MLKIANHNKSITAYYWLIHKPYTILYKMSRKLIKLKTVQNMIEDTPNSNFSSQPKYKHASLGRDRKVREGECDHLTLMVVVDVPVDLKLLLRLQACPRRLLLWTGIE